MGEYLHSSSGMANAVGTTTSVAHVALAIVAWDGFDHTMRSLLPVTDWVSSDNLARAVEWACQVLPTAKDGATYDVRLCAHGAHVRVHATTPSECYHVVWGITSTDEAKAVVRAALHPQGKCHLVDMCEEKVVEVAVGDGARLWD